MSAQCTIKFNNSAEGLKPCIPADAINNFLYCPAAMNSRWQQATNKSSLTQINPAQQSTTTMSRWVAAIFNYGKKLPHLQHWPLTFWPLKEFLPWLYRTLVGFLSICSRFALFPDPRLVQTQDTNTDDSATPVQFF